MTDEEMAAFNEWKANPRPFTEHDLFGFESCWKAALQWKAKQPSLNTSEPALTVLKRVRKNVLNSPVPSSGTPWVYELATLRIIDQEIKKLEGRER